MTNYELDNHIHIFANSNSSVPLQMADKDWRWLIPTVTEELKPPEYWREFYSWIEGEGLPAIAYWAERFVEKHGAVMPGEHAPMTTAKRELIDLSRSEGSKLAFDLSEKVANMEEKIVLRVDEVRAWVAKMRNTHVGDKALESPLTLRKAMREANLREPERDPEKKGDRRVVIDHRPTFVVANFRIDAGDKWERDLKQYHKEPEDAWEKF